MNIQESTALLADLPPIFYGVTASAPVPAMRRPYLDGDVVCATNGLVYVQAEAALFGLDVLASLGRRRTGVPDVDRKIGGWTGDGKTHRLPAWDDDVTHHPSSVVRIGWTPLTRRWVAFLHEHGVREVDTGRTPDDPVRFLCGEVEGLVVALPAGLATRRHRYSRGG